jgi:hypothetical protein
MEKFYHITGETTHVKVNTRSVLQKLEDSGKELYIFTCSDQVKANG